MADQPSMAYTTNGGQDPLQYRLVSNRLVTTNSANIIYTTWPLFNNANSTPTTLTQAEWPMWRPWQDTTWAPARQDHTWAPPPPPTPEQLASIQLRQEEARFAKERARALLLNHLDDEQRKEWETHKRFHLRVPSGRRYCIQLGRQHNIFEVDAKGRRLIELCGHVRDRVPDEDNVLAQKLALEFTEEQFLATCNRWDLRAGRALIGRSIQPAAA